MLYHYQLTEPGWLETAVRLISLIFTQTGIVDSTDIILPGHGIDGRC